jgi:PAS domain S-box-containing protein
MILLMTAFFPSLLMSATGSPKRVLLLDSYGRNVAPVSNLISVFRREVSSRSPEPIDLHEVSLEMARFAQSEQELPFINFLRERFSNHKPDLVVTVGGPAFTFMERHRDLFPAIPFAMTGVAEQVLQSGAIPENSVAISLPVNLKGIVEDILNALPGTTNIEVVLGTSPIETFWLKECRRAFAAFSSQIKFTYLNHLSFKDIRKHVANLPSNSAVFYGMLLVDGAGIAYDPSEALRSLADTANSPIFALNESYFGLGIVGGRLVQERAAGVCAAEVALRILNGEPAGTINVPSLPENLPVYDWRALQRWGISETRLPQGSIIQFRQSSLWGLYRWYILSGVGLLIFQGCLIAGLLVHRRRRALAEHSLQKSEQRLRLITNALPVLIAYVGSDQRYQFNNAVYTEWFGVNPKEAFGRTIREVVGESFYQSLLPYVERVLSGEHVHHAHDTTLPNGRRISIEVIYVPDMDESGVVRGFYAMAMDVTERNIAQQESKRLQDELLHASRITATGELAGALAHEINQPLSAIMSNAQAAKRFLNLPTPDLEEVKEALDDIAAEDARAGEVINRLRAFMKKSKAEFEDIELNGIFREVVGFVHSDSVVRDVKISLELDPRVPPVRGDRIQLQQVVLNLLLNAFDAVSDQPRGERRLWIRTSLEDSVVHAAVKDSGKGVSAAEFENVFKTFFTTKPQGLGMGLSISRSIIIRHQGRIWVENNTGVGTTFHFSLPVAPGEKTLERA